MHFLYLGLKAGNVHVETMFPSPLTSIQLNSLCLISVMVYNKVLGVLYLIN